MGIRYYAYPVDQRQFEFAVQSPHAFIGMDPLMDAWGPVDEQPEMLYLDKCWRYLQDLFATPNNEPDCPSQLLVTGDVTMTGLGWRAFVATRSPDEVVAIADDLGKFDESCLSDYFAVAHRIRYGESVEEEIDYVWHYLADAKAFTRHLSDTGRGLVYQIG